MPAADDDDIPQTMISFGRAPSSLPSSENVGHYLVAVGDDAPGIIVEVTAEPVTIGRDGKQTIVYAGDTEISRRHARVTLLGGQVVVEDLGSTNGTYVDRARISAPTTLREGGVLRVGRQFLTYERRNRRDVERAEELRRDLLKASNYVRSLLPAPLDSGAVHASWFFLPSAQLGGDAFGYHWLDSHTFVFYLLDVSGHGVGAAMHSVTVLNVLRQRALPHVDFASPAEVLSSLNARFNMEDHDGMYFTAWYGVYDTHERRLRFGAAGHHAAFLVAGDRTVSRPLKVSDLMIGAMPDVDYESAEVEVPAGSSLHLFSDGAFEIITKHGRQWTLRDFVPLLLEPPAQGLSEPQRLYNAVREAARPGPLDDDFSLLTLTFS